MIIIGYPGIGKTTTAAKNDKFIDLESSTFWIDPYWVTPDYYQSGRTKWSNWARVYGNIAEHLSKQGYVVFVSCHEDVQVRIAEIKDEKIYICYPGFLIKDDWIKRLKDRYNESQDPKDKRALDNCIANYDSQITALKESKFDKIELSSIDYDLESLIKEKMDNV